MALVEELADGRLLYDISPLVSPQLAVFPGDQAYRRDVSLSFARGDNLTLSAISGTVHLGAHTDAPNHYHGDGVGIDARALSYYLGPCQVIAPATPRGARIRWQDFAATTPISRERVLFRTDSFPDPNVWTDDFTSLDPDMIAMLAQRGVRLIGIDTPSLDPATSKDLPSHAMIYKHNLAILEGIVLSHVPEGFYELIALPLKLADADASPVRAVLLASAARSL